ncbi:MAG TPA: hypothetical protein PLM62_04765 [Zoogloea sp.]|nr:hypothetical protein [Zoogloea sp.]
MVFDGRYIANESSFKQYARMALASRFANEDAFEVFYDALTREKKDEFLRVASFYLFLVKCGDWHVDVGRSSDVIDYLTNSFKLVAMFSLIESLCDLGYKDFYEWLCENKASGVFPIQDLAALESNYKQYKATFGSIRRCVAFFERIPESQKNELVSAIEIGGKPLPSIKRLAEFLYNLRSKFVHEGRVVLQISDQPVMSVGRKRVIFANLPMDLLFATFEEGLLAYFRDAI